MPNSTTTSPPNVKGCPHWPIERRQLRAIVDAYGLSANQRRGFLDRIIEYVISDPANEADDANVTPDMTSHPCALWAMAWRARADAWLLRNRRPLDNALA
jgi:hypothetical protein